MATISTKQDGSVLINGIPKQIGDLEVSYTDTGVRISEKFNTRIAVVDDIWSNVTNEGAPFATFADLKAFIRANFFAEAPEGGVTEAELNGVFPYITPEQFGAVGDGIADDGAFINQAIAQSNGRHVRLAKDYFTAETINLISGVTVMQSGFLKSSQVTVISFDSVRDVKWIGGDIIGDLAITTQSGFLIINSSSNLLDSIAVKDMPNKGIAIGAATSSGQTSVNNRIVNVVVTGSGSSTGAGISLFGDGCKNNVIVDTECYNNRIGITLNGSHYNTLKNPYCHDNWQMGLTMDGIISLTGDGGKYNTIISPVCNANGDATHTTYGGIYIGNGSSWNKIISPVCIGNFGAGIRLTSSVAFNNVGNNIENFLCDGNGVNGITVSGSGQTILSGGVTQNNTGKGIAIFNSDNCQIINTRAVANTLQGIIVQSINCMMSAIRTSGNTMGVRVATGGSPVGDGNLLFNSNILDGIDSDNNLLRVYNETGSPATVLADAGDANYSFVTQGANTVFYNTPITNHRTVTLATTGFKNGDIAKIIRTATATGAFNVNVGSPLIKALSAGEWISIVFDGTAWKECAFGALGPDPKYLLNSGTQQTGSLNLSGTFQAAGATSTIEGDLLFQNAAFRAIQMYRITNAINTGNPQRWYNQDSAAAKVQVAQLLGAMSDNTAGAVQGYFTIGTTTSGTNTEKVRVTATGNLLINTTTDIPCSKSTVASTTQGILIPRMTSTQRLAIVTPVEGLEVYDLTLHKKCIYNGTAWEQVTATVIP